ncbi:MAG: hypothetical protein ACOCO8_11190 [Segatella copri]
MEEGSITGSLIYGGIKTMTVEFLADIYGITGLGKKIKIGSMKELAEGCFLVGGTIFYIDETADGIYEFYDYNENLIHDVKVGDKPYAYRVIKTGMKDKYYVYHDEMYTMKRWTYYKDGAYVYDAIGSLSQNIGTGKANTEIMMSRDNGAYVTADSDGYPTIWYQLQQTRLAKAGGCSDWFIPSRLEIEELRKAIGFQVVTPDDEPIILPAGKVTGGVIAGTADGQAHYKDSASNNTRTCYPSETKFLNNNIWNSSGLSNQYAFYWMLQNQIFSNGSKNSSLSVFFARAF